MASTVLCGRCGAQGDADDQFCGSCGAPRLAAPVESAVFTVDRPSSGSVPSNQGAEGEPPLASSPPPTGTVLREPVPRMEAPAVPVMAADPPVAGLGRVMAPAGPTADQLMGEAVPNSTYLGLRQLYSGPETLDPLINPKWLVQAGLRALFFFFVWCVVGFVVFVFCLLLLVATKSPVIFGLYFFGALVSGLALALLWFFHRWPAVVSEWKFAVDRKGAAETTAFEHIIWAFQQRRTPVKSVRIRRISQPGLRTRDYLEVKDDHFSGYVSCFAYGDDLYIGWTFWLYLSPLQWFILLAKALYLAVTLRGTELYSSLRYDNARAMREAMHGACREGVDVATGEIQPRGQGIVGSEVAIDLTTLTSSD